ncbi:MAG TPA: hypothetical protein VGY99_19755 [Candidatus Binataceae bacterium]|nr:hypothetical protein [Candidatus Binataceae bacterium]
MRHLILTILVLSLLVGRGVAGAADGSELRQIKREIQKIKADEARERERDEKLIGELEQKVDKLESQNQQLQQSSQKLQTQTSQQYQELHEQISNNPSPAQFARSFQDYLGTHQFTLTGAVGGDFIYNRQTATNTFALDFEPIILYKVTDWLLFEGTIEANLPAGGSADFQLPVATAQIFLNDYMELQAGIFDQPFGDWYEDQSPFWVNRFVTAPLPYGVEALVPPTDLGMQLRGGAQWGDLGQDVDYTVWISNGPSFASDIPEPVVGQAVAGVNTIKINTNGQGYGARVRFYPLPLDSNLGRLELGASTLDGKWLNGNWYNAWGVDFAYLRGPLQARGEYLQMYRQMPNSNADNRQGWSLQIGYFLNQIPVPYAPDVVQNFIHRLEPLIRYSGVNQRAIVQDEVSTVPSIGFSGSPSIWTPHPREVALGLDYWLAPSIVWQNEVDLELPEAGGSIIAFGGNPTPTIVPRGATPNDFSFLSQLAIGF